MLLPWLAYLFLWYLSFLSAKNWLQLSWTSQKEYVCRILWFWKCKSQTLVWANNTSDAWPLVEFAASAIVCIYGCILTPTCFFLSIPCKVFSVFAEILPVREREPTRERDKMFANMTFLFANGQRSRMGRNIFDTRNLWMLSGMVNFATSLRSAPYDTGIESTIQYLFTGWPRQMHLELLP